MSGGEEVMPLLCTVSLLTPLLPPSHSGCLLSVAAILPLPLPLRLPLSLPLPLPAAAAVASFRAPWQPSRPGRMRRAAPPKRISEDW